MEEERVVSQGSKRTTTLPADEPSVVAAAPPLLGHAFDDDPAASFDGGGYGILGLPVPAPSYGSVLGDDDEDGDAYDDSDTYSDSDSDSDSEFEEEEEEHGNNRVRFWDGDAAAAAAGSGGEETDQLVALPLPFLGRPTRFATFQGAAAFMRLSVQHEQAAAAASGAAAGGEEEGGGGGGTIVVRYRLTRFSKRGARGVAVREFGTALHHVRYLVPFPIAGAAAGDDAGGDDQASALLRLVGAAVAADVYPYRHYVELQAVWSGLVAALPVRRVPEARVVVVTVDAGVLRGGAEDRTPERMDRLRKALAALARQNDGDASPMPCGLEQRLPAPVSGGGGGEVPRPAKRRRLAAVVEGEVCAICHEALEQGLAAWPRCSHVFHGRCLEQLLVTVQHRCPMCRSTLSIKGGV